MRTNACSSRSNSERHARLSCVPVASIERFPGSSWLLRLTSKLTLGRGPTSELRGVAGAGCVCSKEGASAPAGSPGVGVRGEREGRCI
eukprot:scaffold287_cov337-Pavlova_lutheri.AAC.196